MERVKIPILGFQAGETRASRALSGHDDLTGSAMIDLGMVRVSFHPSDQSSPVVCRGGLENGTF
jgi:hypothetical protein